MTTDDTVVVRAPAKLALELRVTGVRDDGYHLINAEMVSLEWADTLTISPGGSGITADGPFAAGMPLDHTNLVAKALRLTGREAAVHIHKALPHGGGLGGGSSDAAAVLRWAGWTDVAGAAALGADVSYCLVGGRARVTGIGELVEPMLPRDYEITLVVPPVHVSTPEVYQVWDELGGPRGTANDLEPAALIVEPSLVRWRDRIREVTGQRPTLAGSGGTWWLRGHFPALEGALPEATVALTRTDRPR